MTDDIVTRLREQYFTCECFGYGDCSRCESDKKAADEIEVLRKQIREQKCCQEAADEIERLRKWAEYEHAGYCRCAGGNPECVNKAYEVWKSMQ